MIKDTGFDRVVTVLSQNIEQGHCQDFLGGGGSLSVKVRVLRLSCCFGFTKRLTMGRGATDTPGPHYLCPC